MFYASVVLYIAVMFCSWSTSQPPNPCSVLSTCSVFFFMCWLSKLTVWFPTCHVRVVRLYQSWIPPPLLSSPLLASPLLGGEFCSSTWPARAWMSWFAERIGFAWWHMTLRVVSFIAWRPHRALKAPALQTVCGFPGNGAWCPVVLELCVALRRCLPTCDPRCRKVNDSLGSDE